MTPTTQPDERKAPTMDAQTFDTLINAEEAKLAELELAASAAQAAEDGTARAIVAAKLDGRPAAELRRMEADADAAVTTRETAQRAVQRQRAQITELRREFGERTHRAEVEATLVQLEAAREAWPAALAAWDAAMTTSEPLWAELCRVSADERVALRRLEKLGQPPQSVRTPDGAIGKFPVPTTLTTNLHWTFEQYRAEADARHAAHAAARELVESLGNVRTGASTVPPRITVP